MKKQKIDKNTNAETGTSSKKGHELNAWWDHIDPKIELSKELDANFNYPKIYLRSDWVKQIR
jgi:hypothetical protein